MVKSIGCEYVLCGHSERRTVFNDDDGSINRKVKKVLDDDMRVILCTGETKDEYDLNIKNEVCAMQLSKDLAGITKEQMENVVIAYEPVWAIGTGLVCDPKAANEVHAYLRTVLASLYDDEVAQATRIQYGGSVTPDSVDELMSQPEIDGCLVGGKFERVRENAPLHVASIIYIFKNGISHSNLSNLTLSYHFYAGASLDADKFGRIINFQKSE